MRNKNIKEELIKLNFRIESVGSIYWVESIKIMMKNPLLYNMGKIYEKIAKKYQTTSYAVERLMRYAIEPAKKNIQRKYNYYNKVTITTFMDLIRFEII